MQKYEEILSIKLMNSNAEKLSLDDINLENYFKIHKDFNIIYE